MNRATQRGENSRTVLAAWTLRQETRRPLLDAASPRRATNATHSPVFPCTAVSLPPCFPASLPPPSQAKRNRTSNSNTDANRNRRNSLKTKTRPISNSNKNRHFAFTDFPPRVTSHHSQITPFYSVHTCKPNLAQVTENKGSSHFLLGTRRTCLWRPCSLHRGGDAVAFRCSRITSHESRVTHFLRPPMLYCSLLRDARCGRNRWQPSRGQAASKLGRGIAMIPGRRKG